MCARVSVGVMTKYPLFWLQLTSPLGSPTDAVPGWVGQAEGIKNESSGYQMYKSSSLPAP